MPFYKSYPLNLFTAKASPSRKGVPILFKNSIRAAPVPHSPPSIVIKSGLIPVLMIALQMLINSDSLPIESLKPTGLPPDNSLSC